mgnify:CR=1 FL=1
MRSKSRIEKVGAALRRQRHAGGRMLMGYSEDGLDGPLWLDGRIVPAESVTASDTVIRITYQAADDAPNVVHLTWGDDTLTTE